LTKLRHLLLNARLTSLVGQAFQAVPVNLQELFATLSKLVLVECLPVPALKQIPYFVSKILIGQFQLILNLVVNVKSALARPNGGQWAGVNV
jgi:hypothetical protein